ncbi:hypothetical protein [Streptomyces albogriseolus]
MIRRYHAKAPSVWRTVRACFLFLLTTFLASRAYLEVAVGALWIYDHPPFGLKPGDFTLSGLWEMVSSSNAIKFSVLMAAAATGLFLVVVVLATVGAVTIEVLRLQRAHLQGRTPNGSNFTKWITNAIRFAASAHERAPGSPAQQRSLAYVTSSLDTVYDALLRLSDESEAVYQGSRHKEQLREHHRKVIAALQEKEAALYVDVRAALPDLAEMLVRIANAHSDGRIGQLLPASEIAHLTPVEVAKREHFKMVAVAVLLGGGGVLVAFLDLPTTATTSLIGAIGITIVSMVYGHQARKGLELSDSVRGIQRP